MKKHALLFVALFSFLMAAPMVGWAYGVGITSHPLPTERGFFTTEFANFMTAESGVGLQARYTQTVRPGISAHAGMSVSDSSRDRSFFLGSDIEIYPDYDQQPRVSLQANYQRATEYSQSRNIFSLAPTVSKGFNLSGHETYPFVALPTGLELNSDTNKYQVRTALAIGTVGKVPYETLRNMLYNIETNLNINNAFSAIYLGVTFPLEY